MIDDTLLEAVDKMGKAVTHTQSEFAAIRTGRATPALVERLKVEYYGTEVPCSSWRGSPFPRPAFS
jgi:ribosome recycling factor